LGEGDKHETSFTHTAVTFRLETSTNEGSALAHGQCVYNMTLYYSNEFESASGSDADTTLPLSVATAFCILLSVFTAYDRLVRRRNDKIVDAAARSNALISSLFPKQVRDRLLADNEARESNKSKDTESKKLVGDEGAVDDAMYKTKPIADLFPETTVLFADIAGFTSWSSVREPRQVRWSNRPHATRAVSAQAHSRRFHSPTSSYQVFTLLETLFRAFDDIANKRRIFKVRTSRLRRCLLVHGLSRADISFGQSGGNGGGLLCSRGGLARGSQGPCGRHGTICVRLHASHSGLAAQVRGHARYY
jgi:hypothetical protein